MSHQVTVLIPFHNRGQYLAETLKSVYKQTYKNWKVILIDDGSTENYLSFIQKYVRDPRVTLIRNNRNLGKPKSLNKALSHVDTPYVVELDSDDLFYPSTLEVLVSEAYKVPKNVAVIHGNISVFFQDSKGNVIKEITKKGHQNHDRYHFLLSYTGICPRFYRAEALNDVGGFPTGEDDPFETNNVEVEDLAVLTRLIEKYHFHYIDQTLYKYRQHINMQTNNRRIITDKMQWIMREALKRWGDKYDPVFEDIDDGWIKLARLIPKEK